MFDKIWNILFKKKTEQQFRRFLYLDLISCVVLTMGISWLYTHSQPWYPKKILLLLAGLAILYIYTYVRALIDKKYFKQLYFSAYDERNKEIVKLSVIVSYGLVLGIILYKFGYAFGAELVTMEPTMISLSGFCGTLLGTAILGFFGTNLFLQKFY